jgi:mono/diheme cytochrome c family protein
MRSARVSVLVAAAAAAIILFSAHTRAAVADKNAAATDIERGRYMVLTGHCNNCHTAGYAGKQGDVPEKEWLLGNPVGFRLAPGTTYASNLRLTVQKFTEEQWVQYAKASKPRPPMPWWSLHATSDQDLSAMYRYIKSLGAAGKDMPDFVPADKEPARPYEVRQIVR